MECKPLDELIKKMADAGLSRRVVVEELNVPYGTLSTWLRGFAPMPDMARVAIDRMIAERETGVQG